MSDRLADLRRQRALVQEQLAWLDREIASLSPEAPFTAPAQTEVRAAATPAAAIVTAAINARGSLSSSPTATANSPVLAAAADAILDEYRVPPSSLKSDVRKGCLLYFAAAFALVGIGVAILYFALRRE